MLLKKTKPKSDLTVLRDNLCAWNAKPELRSAYARYFKQILNRCAHEDIILEIGAGFGAFETFARERGFNRWISSDILISGKAALVTDATSLCIKSTSIDRVIFVDVLHHLPRPFDFFTEAGRVLKPGGKIICLEPWITFFSWFVGKLCHHEDVRLDIDPENPFEKDGKLAYRGCSGLPNVIVKKTPPQRWSSVNLTPPEIVPLNDFAYLLTGGFTGNQILPDRFVQIVRARLDESAFGKCAKYTGCRAVLEFQRSGGA